MKKIITMITKMLNYTDYNHGLNSSGNGWNWYNVDEYTYNMIKPQLSDLNDQASKHGRRVSYIAESKQLILCKATVRDHKADIKILEDSVKDDDNSTVKPGSWMI